MKHWKRYALGVACACCMAMLTGCGSNDRNTATEKETNAAMTEQRQSDKKGPDRPAETMDQTDDMQQTDRRDDAGRTDGTEGGAQNNVATENTGDVNGVTDDVNDGAARDNDVIDNAGDNEKGGDIGDAGRDIVDGVGDAGKDIIDGVEDGVDELTGNETDNRENR